MFSEAILNPQCWCFLEPNRNYILKMDCEVHHRSISPNNHEHRDTTQKLWWVYAYEMLVSTCNTAQGNKPQHYLTDYPSLHPTAAKSTFIQACG